jgi:predicted nucleotide-binding protein
VSDRPHIFISYARVDAEIARRLRDALADRNLDVWIDVDSLSVGQSWADEIGRALRTASAIVTLFSPASVKSDWVRAEFSHAVRLGLPVIPIFVDVGMDELPVEATTRQGIKLSAFPTDAELATAVEEIARALPNLVQEPASQPEVSSSDLASLVDAEIAKVTRPSPKQGVLDSVFLVHGHQENARADVASFLESIGVRPVVLKDIPGTDQSLLQRFLRVSSEAQFAVVILSADDVGAARRQYDAPQVGERALQFRARQNVILELGFFYGFLGWDHVFGLLCEPDRVFPNFERPSDLDGVVYERIDNTGRWKAELRARLSAAGFVLKPDAV